jgi:hypothetical protein
MRRTERGGLDGVKNGSEKCEGWGGSTGYITHLCIMHGAHTSKVLKRKWWNEDGSHNLHAKT